MHAVLEHYYLGTPKPYYAAAETLGADHPCYASLRSAGALSPVGMTVAAGFPHLPARTACKLVVAEGPASIGGSPDVQGTRDLLVHLLPDERDRLGIEHDWLVVDYKTSVYPSGFARRASALRYDQQGVVYPYSALREHSLPVVSCRWLYMPSRAPYTDVVPVDFVQRRGPRLERAVEALRTQARRLAVLRENPQLATRNPGDCRSYGRLCPHHTDNGGPCNPKEKTMAESMAERIKRLRAEQPANDNAEPEVAPAPEADDPPKRKRGRPRKEAAPADAQPPADEPAPPPTAEYPCGSGVLVKVIGAFAAGEDGHIEIHLTAPPGFTVPVGGAARLVF